MQEQVTDMLKKVGGNQHFQSPLLNIWTISNDLNQQRKHFNQKLIEFLSFSNQIQLFLGVLDFLSPVRCDSVLTFSMDFGKTNLLTWKNKPNSSKRSFTKAIPSHFTLLIILYLKHFNHVLSPVGFVTGTAALKVKIVHVKKLHNQITN